MLWFCLIWLQETQAIRPVHTYSIVAIDKEQGEMGVAVQSHWFSVGSVVCWARSGAGVVATQSLVEPAYGYQGLEWMSKGLSAPEAFKKIQGEDPTPQIRQVAMIDSRGGVVSFTGEKCIAEAGDQRGSNYAVQANIMEKSTVWPAMALAFESSKGSLARRMLAALQAAEGEGGDLRGKQSAALLVVKIAASPQPWKDGLFDLRVDDHPEPLEELARLLHVAEAYRFMDLGDEQLGKGRLEQAKQAYGQAMDMLPGQSEITFWTAVTMVSLGEREEAMALFAKALGQNPKWGDLLPRLSQVELFPQDAELLQKIQALRP
jgi:uncharacterized Ntn-hydrolase superfamily protein